jgi:hypothetical protein
MKGIHKKIPSKSTPLANKGPIEQFDKNISCHFNHIQPTQPKKTFH